MVSLIAINVVMDRFLSSRNTAEQAAIIAHPRNDGELVLIEAVAGSGKTHTIVERALKTSTPTCRSLMLAFNSAAQKQIFNKVAAKGAGNRVKAKTTTVYARAWDNKVRMCRNGHEKSWAAIPDILSEATKQYDERASLLLLGSLQVRKSGDRLRGGIARRLPNIVKALSSLKEPVTPKSAGWTVDELRTQWLYIQLEKGMHVDVDALKEAWTRYATTVLQPLFPYVPSDDFSVAFLDDGAACLGLTATEPAALSMCL